MPLAYQEHYTFDDYQHWEGHWELIEGMPYAMTPSPSVTHQIVAFNVATSIKNALKNQKTNCSDRCTILLETDWQIANDTVVRPDVMVICQDIDEKVLVTPDLIIEVVSSTSVKRDEIIKLDLYQREGLPYYILVYPDNRLAKVYRNNTQGFIKQGDYSFEKVEFAIHDCRFNIDFAKIWR